MMDVISQAIIDELVASIEPPCVSITMPTHRFGREVMEDPIHYKNLLGQAERRLVERGLRSPDAIALLEPARGVIDDEAFWAHQDLGLVAYAHVGGLRTFRVPVHLNAHVGVNDAPDLEPLRSLLEEASAIYWVLAISGNGARLVRANRFDATEVELPGAPQSLADANRYVRRDPQIRAKTVGRVGTGQVGTSFHGPGGHEHDIDEDLHRYLRGVDAGVREAIGASTAPIVLAGVGATLAEFRHVSSLRHLTDRQLAGNPDLLDVGELHRRTVPLVDRLLV